MLTKTETKEHILIRRGTRNELIHRCSKQIDAHRYRNGDRLVRQPGGLTCRH